MLRKVSVRWNEGLPPLAVLLVTPCSSPTGAQTQLRGGCTLTLNSAPLLRHLYCVIFTASSLLRHLYCVVNGAWMKCRLTRDLHGLYVPFNLEHVENFPLISLHVQRGVNLFELFAKHQPGVAGCGWLQAGRNFLST